jgi:hypothetical protein
MRLTLTGEERVRLARRQTDNTDAYHLYFKAGYYWSKRTPPDLKKSIEYFEEAIAKDPGYALAYTGLASAYVVMTVFDLAVPTVLFTKAKAAVLRAFEVDGELAGAGRARRDRRGHRLAGAGLSRALLLVGVLGQGRSPARRAAA